MWQPCIIHTTTAHTHTQRLVRFQKAVVTDRSDLAEWHLRVVRHSTLAPTARLALPWLQKCKGFRAKDFSFRVCGPG